jgi:hypothetical protein
MEAGHKKLIRFMSLVSNLSLVLCLVLVAADRPHHFSTPVDKLPYFQHDTSADKLKGFRQFSDEFFAAVKRNDTSFLRVHTVFPITGSSFYIFDESLMQKKITARSFFSKLKKLFPEEDTKRIRKEGHFNYVGSGGKDYYVIELIFHEEDVDSNYSWFFTKEGGVFYFINFKAEAG